MATPKAPASSDGALFALPGATVAAKQTAATRAPEPAAVTQPVRSVGASTWDNALIHGDAGEALDVLLSDPAWARRYRGKVRCAYVDPPFNTGKNFAHYNDAYEHDAWLSMMRERFTQIRDLLSDDGSIWVHLDDAEMAYARVMLDEVFGRGNFVATIVWQKRRSREGRSAFSISQDYIFVYSKAAPVKWKATRNSLASDMTSYRNIDDDPRGPWKAIPMSAQGWRPNQMYEITTPTGVVHTPPAGGCWRNTRERFDALVADGRIYWAKGGDGRPARKRYAFEDTGLVPHTMWTAVECGDNTEAKREAQALFPDALPFSTPKPERLIERVLAIATNPGDVVLDCFAGSGATAAVAHKTGRAWITVEREGESVDTFVAPRLTRVVAGTDPGGITESAGHTGGGSFSVYDVHVADGGAPALVSRGSQAAAAA